MTPKLNVALPFLAPQDHSRTIRDRIETLTREVASGQTADAGRALGSDFSSASVLAHNLRQLTAFGHSLSAAETWGDTIQASLDQVSSASTRLADALPTSVAALDTNSFGLATDAAKAAAADIGLALNQSVSGRKVFGNGAEIGAVVSVDAVLGDVAALSAASGSFDAYVTAVDTYFEDGGAFETTRLPDLSTGPAGFPVATGERVAFDVDAGDQALRQALAQAALVAGMEDAGFAIPSGQKSEVVAELQVRSANVGSALGALQGRVGLVEGRISELSERTIQERQDSETTLSNLLEADPFETATRLQNELSRLETLYAITARRSQLRLTDYL